MTPEKASEEFISLDSETRTQQMQSCIQINVPCRVLERWNRLELQETVTFGGKAMNEATSIGQVFQQSLTSTWKCSVMDSTLAHDTDRANSVESQMESSCKDKSTCPEHLQPAFASKSRSHKQTEQPCFESERTKLIDACTINKKSTTGDRLSTEKFGANSTTSTQDNLAQHPSQILAGREPDVQAKSPIREEHTGVRNTQDTREFGLRTRSGRTLDKTSREPRRHTDRVLNKQLYELNQVVAKDMGYGASNENVQICIVCGEKSKTKWHLLLHLRRFHQIQSGDYFKLLTSSAEDRSQKIEKFKAETKESREPKLAGTLPCTYCHENIVGIRNMKRHLKLRHQTEGNYEESVEHFTREYAKLIHRNRMISTRKENLSRTEYPCKFCGQVLSLACTRSRHQMYTCAKNPDRLRRVHCNFCGVAFKTKAALEEHRQSHASHGFQYVCDSCGKVCKTKAMLHEHRRKDHLGKLFRYSCDKCDKKFYHKDQLSKHSASHSDRREAICDICGKMFKTGADVEKHKKTVHQRQYPYHCPKCGHGMAKLRYLKAHKCGRVRRLPKSSPEVTTTATREIAATEIPSSTETHQRPNDLHAAVHTTQNLQQQSDTLRIMYYPNDTVQQGPTLNNESFTASQYLVANSLPVTVASSLQQTSPSTSTSCSTTRYTELGVMATQEQSGTFVHQYTGTVPLLPPFDTVASSFVLVNSDRGSLPGSIPGAAYLAYSPEAQEATPATAEAEYQP